MPAHTTHPGAAEGAFSGALNDAAAGTRPLLIAIVNNMPDPALRATERHFCRLLGAASAGMTVSIKFYAPPVVSRAGAIRDHLDSFYENFDALERDRPDGLIVTGAEPTGARLQDEPIWPALTRLIDWADEEAIPGVWSCLAAHAAVLHVDDVQRVRRNRKLSGVFACTVVTGKHQILHRLPHRMQVPHSRLHGLERSALEAQGYTVLSASPAVGVDMFIKQASALQLYLQGHPEYESRTLLSEYRRDVLRAACVAGSAPPVPPEGIGNTALRVEIAAQAARVVRRSADSMAQLDALLRLGTPEECWLKPAQNLFANWLAHLDARRTKAYRRAGMGVAGLGHLPAAERPVDDFVPFAAM